jgi:serine acetyltransferase
MRIFKDFFIFIDSILARDRAARSQAEVVFLYPGVAALGFYRLAHWLWDGKLPFPAVAISPIGRNLYMHRGRAAVIAGPPARMITSAGGDFEI